MRIVLDALESSDTLIQWWHDVGSVAPQLPEALRPNWLSAISQVVRHFRSFTRSTDASERRWHRSLCHFSLCHFHAELSTLLSEGYLTMPQLEHLSTLEDSLQTALQE